MKERLRNALAGGALALQSALSPRPDDAPLEPGPRVERDEHEQDAMARFDAAFARCERSDELEEEGFDPLSPIDYDRTVRLNGRDCDDIEVVGLLTDDERELMAALDGLRDTSWGLKPNPNRRRR